MKKIIIKLLVSTLMIVFMNFGLAGDDPFADGYVQDKEIFEENLR